MDLRKWAADAAASPPTAPVSPSDGHPTDGNPLTATPATQPGAYWFYALAEEIRNVLVDGGQTPSISTLTQLRDAIRNIAKGGDYKDSVRVASTAAINLAAPGATIDGVAMVAGDRFLEKDNATLANRGIYIWNGAAVAATRAMDADTGAELNSGTIIPVESGSINADSNWQLTTDGTIIIGTTGLDFIESRRLGSGYLSIRDEKVAGSDGGSSIAGTQTRILNTITNNTIPGAALAGNQITLPKGTYRINASAPAFGVNDHVLWLRNVTDSTNVVIGTSENTNSNAVSAADPIQTRSHILGRFTLPSQKVLDLRHYTELAVAAFGLGRTSAGPGIPATFTLCEIVKESD